MLMEDMSTTVRARHLGRALDTALRATGMTASEISALLSWSPSKTSRMLSGKRGPIRDDVAAFLAVCRVVGERRRELLDLCGDLYAPMWWQATGSSGLARRQVVSDAESDAYAITAYDPAAVPVLLQEREYTRAVLSTQPIVPAAEIGDRMAEIEARQHIVDNHDWYQRRVTAFVEARTLNGTGAGDLDALSAQWHKLLRLAVGPSITIRVLPVRAWVHAPAAFTLLEFAEHNHAVCIEQPTCVGFLEGSDMVDSYRSLIAELDRTALDEEASRQWIAELADARSTELPDCVQVPADSATGIWAS